MRHLSWTREGRQLALETGQRAYKGRVGQTNLELADGSFAPYVWDGDSRTLRYSDIEARFIGAAIEFWRGGDLVARTTPRLERRIDGTWRTEAGRVRVERLEDEDDLGPIASARIALVIESEHATARHILVAGGWYRARADTELVVRHGEYRVVIAHELGPSARREWRMRGAGPLVAAGYVSERDWRVAWTGDEDAERDVIVDGDRLEVRLPAVYRSRAERRRRAPAVQWTSPDTYGPAANAGAGDDVNCDGSDYFEDGYTGSGADNFHYLDDTFAGQGHVCFRFASIDLGGTPASIDAGTKLTLERTGSSYGNGGANGLLEFRVQDSNTPATGSSGDRPHSRTLNTTSVNTHTFPNSTATQEPALNTCIGALRTAGYSYTGSSSHAIMVVGAAGDFGQSTVSYRVIVADVVHPTAVPADLTIVYTPATPGSIAGTSAGVATATGAIAASGQLVGQSNGTSSARLAAPGTYKLFRISPGRIARAWLFGEPSNATELARAEFFGPDTGGLSSIAGTSAGVATTTGVVAGSGQLVGVIAGVATGTGNLTDATGSNLAGTSAGAATASGDLRGSGALSGAIAGTATVAGAVAGPGSVSSTSVGVATVSGAVAGSGALSGASAGAATVSGSVAGSGALTGASNGVATGAGAVVGSGALVGAIAGTATTSAVVAGPGTIAGASNGVASVTGNLTDSTSATSVGSSAGVATVSGDLRGSGALSGTIAGAATVTGAATGPGAIASTSAGVATGSGLLVGSGALSGASAGAATVSGAAYDSSTTTMQGTSAGGSTASGSLRGSGSLFGASAGLALAAAVLLAVGSVAGASAGVATGSGAIAGLGQLSGIANANAVVVGLLAVPGVTPVDATVTQRPATSIRVTMARSTLIDITDQRPTTSIKVG